MATDVWEELAAWEVPPPPTELEGNVHQRLNDVQTFGHVAELLLRAMPYALWHFAAAVASLLYSTISGRYEAKSK